MLHSLPSVQAVIAIFSVSMLFVVLLLDLGQCGRSTPKGYLLIYGGCCSRSGALSGCKRNG
jgi:hypothetical protein